MNAQRILGSAVLSVATVLAAAAASAEDGVWRVGTSYVIRHENLDLTTHEGRQGLLDMVEKAARRACRNEATRSRRLDCQAAAVEQALAAEPTATRDAVDLARLERDGSVLAQR